METGNAKVRLHCADFGFGECCSSCHSEWADDCGDPIEIEGPRGVVAYVCCAVADELRAEIRQAAWRLGADSSWTLRGDGVRR